MFRPQARGSSQWPAQSGIRPTAPKATMNIASSETRAMSPASSREVPAPAMAPWATVMVGLTKLIIFFMKMPATL